jgi:hypothetical protein
MIAGTGSPVAGGPTKGFDNGSVLGKRYVDETGLIEVLCVKPGQGSIAVNGHSLRIVNSKPLPSSD